MPAKHATDDAIAALLMPVNGHMLEFSRGDQHLYRVYITGDTMLNDRLKDIPRFYSDIDLGLTHAGGTTFLITLAPITGEQAFPAVTFTRPLTPTPFPHPDSSVITSGSARAQQAAAKTS